MYHMLGIVAVVLGIVFIWAVGSHDYKLGAYFAEIYAAVILFFMFGLIMLSKKYLQKTGGRKDGEAQPGELCKELYLISERHDDEISYRVENAEKAAEYEAVGKIINGRVYSLKLCAHGSEAMADILVAREHGAKQYVVCEGEQVLGTIKVRKEGSFFTGVDDTVRYSTGFAAGDISEEDEAVEGIMTLVTLGMISRGAKANTLVIKGSGGEVLGKYFFPLRNLELITNGNGGIDRRIAVVLAIMTDVRLQLAE